MNPLTVTDQFQDITQIFNRQKVYFQSGDTLPVENRKKALRKLKRVIKSNEDMLYEAIYKDLRKSPYETYSTEIGFIYDEIDMQLSNIQKWARVRRVGTNIVNIPGTSYVKPHPFGVSLILGAWNYPYHLNLIPAVDALAAGNTVVLKPSEVTPHSSWAIATMINKNFSNKFFTVVEGAVDVATKLLDMNWDKIFFTGSTRVGKIVMKAAARHLSHITLELGGKSPVIVSDSVSMDLAAKRIMWGKCTNAGQTCIAPDYALVHEAVIDDMLDKFKKQAQQMYQMGKAEEAYGRIVNEEHFDRLVGYLDQGAVYAGGDHDRNRLWIAPAILTNVDPSAPVMNEEIFGPILPVIPFSKWEQAIEVIRNKPHPMAVYVFSNRKSEQKMAMDRLSFGGMTINDTMQHIVNHHLPFGGVGASGMGSYHGQWGFDEFSHQKAIQKKARWIDIPLKYPPYTDWKEKMLKWILR